MSADGHRRYRAYGLCIRSDFVLAELAEAGEGDVVDLHIVRSPVAPPPEAPSQQPHFDFAPGSVYLGWPGVARFRVLGPHRIEAEVDGDGSDHLLALPLLGPVIALLLHLRGLLVLHGSAMVVGGRGIAFLGDKGAGKSTTAAALCRAGHFLVSDDVLAVDLSGPDGPRLLPASPQLRLTQSAAESIAPEGASALPSPHPQFTKRIYRLEQGPAPEAIAPSCLYVLSRGAEARAEPLGAIPALQALLRFSYIARFGDRLLGGEAAARHLSQCAALARATVVRSLTAPDRLDRLDALAALVERDVSAILPRRRR